MTKHLRSDQFDILQIIHNKGPILVKDIKDHISIDQGKIEAAVGTLSNYSLIEKKSINNIIYELTKRGVEIINSGFDKIPNNLISIEEKKKNLIVKLINNIEDADIKDGGAGAFYIYLRKK